MSDHLMPDPSFLAAHERLRSFLPRAGKAYAANRNYDHGIGRHVQVSGLSPYIRHRLIDEVTVLSAVLEQHSYSASEKFIQEVCWRTYWKGWLQQRPKVWDDYRKSRDALYEEFAENKGYVRAVAGETDIECFDYWVDELVTTGYLHNHARMWFASIWIFTLKLPWELGADFFLRHLMDADAASNTLSWRWVAGLQTEGKTYLARPDNIAKYTDGRFTPSWSDLSSDAEPAEGPVKPEPMPIEPISKPDEKLKTLFLAHEDDLFLDQSDIARLPLSAVAVVHSADSRGSAEIGAVAKSFTVGACINAAEKLSVSLGQQATVIDLLSNPDELIRLVQSSGAEQVLVAEMPIGPLRDTLLPLLDQLSIPVIVRRREWDDAAWPFATKGFFAFKKQIPELIETHVRGQLSLLKGA